MVVKIDVCLYHSNRDYLDALDRACLKIENREIRLTFFSSETKWAEKVNSTGFCGLAVAPQLSLNLLSLDFTGGIIILTDAFESTFENKNQLSIYASLDHFFSVLRMYELHKSDPKRRQYLVFSFSSFSSDRVMFQQLNQYLKTDASSTIIDLTTLRRVATEDTSSLSDWMWDEIDDLSKLFPGKKYALYHNCSDIQIHQLSEWRVKFSKGLLQLKHPVWIWCGSEWHDLIEIAFASTDEILWISETLQDIETAELWTRDIKRRRPGIISRLIAPRTSSLHEFDSQHVSLHSCIEEMSQGNPL